MADFTRRAFLNNLAGFSMLAVPGLNATLNKPDANMKDDNVTFEIKFTGPFGFILDGDYYEVYAPYTTFQHYPVVSSDAGELLLNDAYDYVVNPPLPVASSSTLNSPIKLDAHNPLDYAKNNCRIGIKVPRPDTIKGINMVEANVNGSSQSLPSGVRFIYNKIPRNQPPIIKNSQKLIFDPKFQSFQPDDPEWELNIRMIPANTLDPCHIEAELSFAEVARLCSVMNPPVLDYGEGPNCKALVGHAHREKHFGPGSDCQTLPILINLI